MTGTKQNHVNNSSLKKPLVHTLQTSVRNHVKEYHVMLRSRCLSDWQRGLNLYSLVSDKKAERYKECCSRAVFAIENETRQVRVLSSACNLRFCPVCKRKYQKFVTEEVKTWFEHAHKQKFLTLTWKSEDAPLSHQIDSMYKCFRKLKLSKEFKKYCKGGIWFFQVTHNPTTDLWHPHLHILLDADYWNKKRISKLWYQVTKTSIIVDIRNVSRQGEKVSEYVSRYALECTDLTKIPDDRLKDLYESTLGRRLCGTFGTARGVMLKRRKKDETVKYTKLTMFRIVIELAGSDDRFATIINCWQTGQPLPDSIDISDFNNFFDGEIKTVDPPFRDYLQQPWFPELAR
jgi:hypothetical protein